MRGVFTGLAGLGVGLFTAGILSFIFGGWVLRGRLNVIGVGMFGGSWSSADYCFLGAILASIGSGLATVGFLGRGRDQP